MYMDVICNIAYSFAQITLVSLVPVCTSAVPISFMADFQIFLSEQGARFRKPTPHFVNLIVCFEWPPSWWQNRLLATLLCGGRSARPKLERTSTRSLFHFCSRHKIWLYFLSLVAGIIPLHLAYPWFEQRNTLKITGPVAHLAKVQAHFLALGISVVFTIPQFSNNFTRCNERWRARG